LRKGNGVKKQTRKQSQNPKLEKSTKKEKEGGTKQKKKKKEVCLLLFAFLFFSRGTVCGDKFDAALRRES
jgi:hypothetical protein